MEDQDKVLNTLQGKDPYFKEDADTTPKTLLSEERHNPENMALKVVSLIKEANDDKEFLEDVIEEMKMTLNERTEEAIEDNLMDMLGK